MKAYITLKENFSKKRYTDLGKVQAKAELSNGACYEVTILLYHELVIIKKIDSKESKINEEEKMAIVEELLEKYTSTKKSLLNFTASYNIERFKIVELTTESDVNTIKEINDLQKKASKDDILLEYIKSDYSKISFNAVFRALNEIYYKLEKSLVLEENVSSIKLQSVYDAKSKKTVDVLQVQVGYQFEGTQKADLEHYTHVILSNMLIFKTWKYCKIKYNKKQKEIKIELE